VVSSTKLPHGALIGDSAANAILGTGSLVTA
jgi:hypothetical protein